MLELAILAIYVTCLAGMIPIARGVATNPNPRPLRDKKVAAAKEDNRPVLERENGKREMEKWLKGFLAKLKRTSTRTQKCRLISSVERMKFENDAHSCFWQYVRFGEDEGEIFNKNKISLEKIKLTDYQKVLLKSYDSLKDRFLSRSEIKQETGKWIFQDNHENRKISEGGEALVISNKFGDLEAVVRIHIFDSSLFTKDFWLNSLTWKIHFEKDYEKAVDKKINGKQNQIPKHENVIKNFANVELFHKEDSKKEDCLGWITIMEKADEDLRTILKEEKIGIDERKKIAEGIKNGYYYLTSIGIFHCDLKLENILMVGGIPKIIDFGLVMDVSEKSGYREMGYVRRGSKFTNNRGLFAGTPGFAYQNQFGYVSGKNVCNLFYFLFCDWKTSWTLLYKPIDNNERTKIDEIIKNCNASSIHEIKENDYLIISKITSIIEIPASSSIFCLDDPNLTKSVNVSCLKQNATKFLNQDLQNVTKNVFDQKSSNLCVPISVVTLLRFAIKNDLHLEDILGEYSAENILAILTIIIYPRSMAGLNLNPNENEKEFQTNEIELLLERVCKKTYLMESGWQIIRELYFGKYRPKRSTCKFENVLLNENFNFTRPLTVTGAYLLPDLVTVFFHQMVLDRIDNPTDSFNAEYVIHNTSFDEGGPVLKIPKTRAYYVNEFMMQNNQTGPTEYKYYGQNGEFMWLVNENYQNMQPNTWYLLPQAYSLTLDPEPGYDSDSSDSDSLDSSDSSEP